MRSSLLLPLKRMSRGSVVRFCIAGLAISAASASTTDNALAEPVLFKLTLTSTFAQIAHAEFPGDVTVTECLCEETFTGLILADTSILNTTLVKSGPSFPPGLDSFTVQAPWSFGHGESLLFDCPPVNTEYPCASFFGTMFLDDFGVNSDINGKIFVAVFGDGLKVTFDVGFPIPNGPNGWPDLNFNVTRGQFLSLFADVTTRDVHFGTYSITRIPQPASVFLVGIGVLGMLVLKRRRY